MNKKFNLITILSLIICSVIIFSSKINFTTSNFGNVVLSQTTSQSYNGEYDGDISIMYLEFDSIFDTWGDQNSSEYLLPHNASIEEREYQIYELDLVTDYFVNESGGGVYDIATNISRQISLQPARIFAQEFTVPELASINTIWLYLNYSVVLLPDFGHYYFVLHIFDENFEEEIDVMWYDENRKEVDEWVMFHPNPEIYEPGKKYFFFFHLWAEEYGANVPMDYWKAESYTHPSQNKGLTLRFDGISGWDAIPNDNLADMLCFFSYSSLINPADVGFKYFINGEFVNPIFQESQFGVPGYEAFATYTFDTRLDDSVNVTVLTNQTLPNLNVWIEFTYLYLINATGNYTANGNTIEWTIEYPYEELSFGWPPPIFLFERDWNYISFSDPDDNPMQDIYFGPMDLYNQSYYGIATFFSPPLERGTYTGKFTSPNYCNEINTMVESGSTYIKKTALELGQTIVIEAEIHDTLNNLVSGGSGQIIFKTPSGTIIHNQTDISVSNGIMSSSDILLTTALTEGSYEAIIFWTDGKEVAYYSISIEITDPAKLILYMGIAIVVAIASVPLILVTRRQLKRRNWEKSLKNLFVLTKDGLSIYEYSFGIEIQDPALISAMIAALTNFVREATGSKKSLRTVDQEDKKVILYHGDYITTALLSEKDLPIIHKRILDFTEAFEAEYGKGLKGWKGETSIFKGAEVIVNQYFPLDVEDQVIRGVKGKLIEFREQLDLLHDPPHIISLMKYITEFIGRYRTIVNTHYLDFYNEIIAIAEKKIILA